MNQHTLQSDPDEEEEKVFCKEVILDKESNTLENHP